MSGAAHPAGSWRVRRGKVEAAREEGAAKAQEAVARLFSDHNSALVRFLRLRLKSDQEARDVAQEAYVRLLQLDQPGAVSFLRAYLFRTAANIATDRLRRAAVRRAVDRDPVFEDEADGLDPERAALARERLLIVDAGLRELPEKVRAAFLLHRLGGLSCAEIAPKMALSERMIRNYIVQAMVHCRLRLDDAEPDQAEGSAS
jgi:RNA polymerase sigma factor (sigma-70 family)